MIVHLACRYRIYLYHIDKSENECSINQVDVKESFNGNKSLKKVSKRALANQDLAREYKRIDKRMSEGVKSIDIGKDLIDLGNGMTYVRGTTVVI